MQARRGGRAAARSRRRAPPRRSSRVLGLRRGLEAEPLELLVAVGLSPRELLLDLRAAAEPAVDLDVAQLALEAVAAAQPPAGDRRAPRPIATIAPPRSIGRCRARIPRAVSDEPERPRCRARRDQGQRQPRERPPADLGLDLEADLDLALEHLLEGRGSASRRLRSRWTAGRSTASGVGDGCVASSSVISSRTVTASR